MNKIVIDVQLGSNIGAIELELDASKPIQDLLQPIRIFLNCPETTAEGKPLQYWMETKDGAPLNQHLSLSHAGVGNGATLVLNAGDAAPAQAIEEPAPLADAPRQAAPASREAASRPSPDPQERRKVPSVPASWKKISR